MCNVHACLWNLEPDGSTSNLQVFRNTETLTYYTNSGHLLAPWASRLLCIPQRGLLEKISQPRYIKEQADKEESAKEKEMTDDDSNEPYASPYLSKDSGSNAPSGFVLKLFQMVNGAPDEVISWLPQGDAFRISDLEKLEAETLPTYFRHNRFQSLVRQLNFYNFRKVNRERTFWVYRHPLFHRDKPQNLHLLRRRTCPGVDGRKHKPDYDIQTLESNENLDFPGQAELLNETDGESPIKLSRPVRPKRHASKRSKVEKNDDDCSSGIDDLSDESADDDRVVVGSLTKAPSGSGEAGHALVVAKKRGQEKNNGGMTEREQVKRARTERLEQSLMVSHVAQRLEEFAKRAEGEISGQPSRRSRGAGVRGAGIVTPPSDTMRYHALTYDDEAYVEVDDEEFKEGNHAKVDQRHRIKDMDCHLRADAVVTDDGESDGDVPSSALLTCGMESEQNIHLSQTRTALILAKDKLFDKAPINNEGTITSLSGKLSGLNEALGVVAMYCMATAPHDVEVTEKTLKVLKSCTELEHEFDLYRSALRPESTNPVVNEVVYDFKVFSVNCLRQFLSEFRLLDTSLLNAQEVSALKLSTDMWVESLGYF